jgi:solute carrier family 35 (UDP-sugar transporter), member A1/2/3
MHYSRSAPALSGPRYLASTAVLLVEIIKLGLSLSVATHDLIKKHPSTTPRDLAVLLYHDCFAADSWKLVIPAALYTLQNSLVYVAISNLDAVTFQVTYQLKILTTVVFSILLLGRTITSRQWLSLLLLTAGVAIVQTSSPISGGSVTSFGSWDEIKARLSNLIPATETLKRSVDVLTSRSAPDSALLYPSRNATTGLLAVLAASIISGLTCVYFEKLLKDSLDTVSLWTRNVQLSFYSLFPALFIGVLWQDGATIAEHGFFVGYRPVVWATILLQAAGGIIVAACMAYADNVAKNYAASASIVVCGVVGAVFFGVPITPNVSLTASPRPGACFARQKLTFFAVYDRHSSSSIRNVPIPNEETIDTAQRATA